VNLFYTKGPAVGVASRQDIELLFDEDDFSDVVLISIRGTEEQPVKIKPSFRDVLSLQFDDVDGDDNLMADEVPMSTEQADSIARFAAKHRTARLILCHCYQGVSRSAGMAAAILKWFGANESIILNHRVYLPNLYVYGLVSEALQELNTERQLNG
jgi:predicted protein tyrosine phosphatase